MTSESSFGFTSVASSVSTDNNSTLSLKHTGLTNIKKILKSWKQPRNGEVWSQLKSTQGEVPKHSHLSIPIMAITSARFWLITNVHTNVEHSCDGDGSPL